MRKFSLKEKKFISQLTESEVLAEDKLISLETFLSETFIGDKYGANLGISNNVAYLTVEGDLNNSKDKLISLVIFINLIKYLESEGLIILVENINSAIGKASGKQYEQTFQLPQGISRYLISNLGCLILPTEGLKFLVKNKFVSDEAVRHRSTMIVAYLAIVVSLIIGILG